MTTFSDRNNLRPELSFNMDSDSLKRRILLVIRKFELTPKKESYGYWADRYDFEDHHFYETPIEKILYEFGIAYNTNASNWQSLNYDKLEKTLMEASDWYVIYDVMELYLEYVDRSKKILVASEFDKILQSQKTQYCILEYKVVPKLTNIELETIKDAQATPFDSVNQLFKSAMQLFSDRMNPDYRNSIKDSIIAVESMCRHITGNSKATLGECLSVLEKGGINLHKSLKNAFSALYGYTSDDGVFRHGNVEFENPQIEDARFMLVTCSAFVNYLSDKYKLISCK